jgi:hypothetical protein
MYSDSWNTWDWKPIHKQAFEIQKAAGYPLAAFNVFNNTLTCFVKKPINYNISYLTTWRFKPGSALTGNAGILS